MNEGDKVVFTGHRYNIAKIFKYNEIFRDKDLIIENIIRCPCNDNRMDKLKFKGIEGYYKSLFFEREEV